MLRGRPAAAGIIHQLNSSRLSCEDRLRAPRLAAAAVSSFIQVRNRLLPVLPVTLVIMLTLLIAVQLVEVTVLLVITLASVLNVTLDISTIMEFVDSVLITVIVLPVQ